MTPKYVQCATVPLRVHVSFSDQDLLRPYLLQLFLWTDAIIFGNLRTHTSVKKKKVFSSAIFVTISRDRAWNERTHFSVAGSTKVRKRVRDSGGDAGDFCSFFFGGSSFLGNWGRRRRRRMEGIIIIPGPPPVSSASCATKEMP